MAEDPAPRGRKRRQIGRAILLGSVGTISVAGLSLAGTAAVAPEAVEQFYGTVQGTAAEVVTAVAGPPSIRLGAAGGDRELDACNGTFTLMRSYQGGDDEDRVPPVWAAHNGCGGDAILHLGVGDILVVKDAYGVAATQGVAPGKYRVVDERITSKTWTPISDLFDMGGEFVVQSCHYGRPTMLFLGLEPIED